MKQQVSPKVLVAVIAMVVLAIGAVYFRQFAHTAPTPHPNRGVDTGGHSTSGPTNPGQ